MTRRPCSTSPRRRPTGAWPRCALLAAACHGPPADSGDDTGHGPPPTEETCPADMVPVADGDDLLFCIDAYEVTVEGDLGDADPLLPGAAQPVAVAISAAGVIPTIHVSFAQALSICAQTPVLDALGQPVGFKHLVTSQEWEDAGDGQPGEGGLVYPYGDTFEDGVCATLDADGTQRFQELQPTGSLPGCVSPYGAYDQVGNAWEWSDPGLVTDVSAWTDQAAREGVVWWTDEVGHLALADESDIARLTLLVVPFPQLGAELLEDGVLCADIGTTEWPINDPVWGYLILDRPASDFDVEAFLPVRLTLDEEIWAARGCAPISLFEERDGYPLTDKRGGAYYVGEPLSCQLASHFLDHTAESQITVSFRCAAEPLAG